jgi:hypothetical protein
MRFPKSRFPLVEMRVRVLQVEYSLRRHPESIYIQKQKQYFDLTDEVFLQELWDGQGWDWGTG